MYEEWQIARVFSGKDARLCMKRHPQWEDETNEQYKWRIIYHLKWD